MILTPDTKRPDLLTYLKLRLYDVVAGRKTTTNQRRAQTTSPTINNVRHIDVSDVIAADFRLTENHKTPTQGQVNMTQGQLSVFQSHVTVSQGQVKVVVGNGSVGPRQTKTPRREEVGRNVDQSVSEVAALRPADDKVHADDVTQVMTCDGRGCGHHDDGFRSCDERGMASLAVSCQTVAS